MHQTHGADSIGVEKFGVEFANLVRQQQTFVDDCAGGERRDVKEVLVAHLGLRHLRFAAFADGVKATFEFVGIEAGRTSDKELLDIGLRRTRDAPDGIPFHGCIAPT